MVLIAKSTILGDVLSGKSSSGIHHHGILEELFGIHWWTGRFFVLLITTLVVFLPLTCFKRLGKQALNVSILSVFSGSKSLFYPNMCFIVLDHQP